MSRESLWGVSGAGAAGLLDRRAGEGMSHRRFSVAEWSLRRKLALALTIPMVLAAVFGGLRVRTELDEAANYVATESQVTVLRPAVGYLTAAERAAVVARGTDLDDPERTSVIEAVDYAGQSLEDAAAAADLTPEQQAIMDDLLATSGELRDGRAYVSPAGLVSQVRRLQSNVTALVSAISTEQINPDPRLLALVHVLDGRLSLSMQQVMVAYKDGSDANPVELAAEVGVEAAAVDRLAGSLDPAPDEVLELQQENALRFGEVRSGGTDMGALEAYSAYDKLSVDLLDGIDAQLAAGTAEARRLVGLNAAVTLGALLLAFLLALMVSRLLLRPIRTVRDGALEVANERLPEVVAKIRAGEDPGEIVPIAVTTHEDMGQLARAVDDLHRQAVVLASGEAQLRSQVGDMFVTLSRRNTSLINQQLRLIEHLENDEEDPQRLESLFRLDHLASRMRRTAESLMVLADAPTRGEAAELTIADALHAANAGVQDYQRVQIVSTPPVRIKPAAAGDVVHLLTEVVDNALAYSPPTTPVLVMTTATVHGTTIQISDAGLGIPADVLTALNEDLRVGGDINAETARRMGLLVVGRLARRHGITVRLEANERGGTTATIVLPGSILFRAAPAPEADEPTATPVARAPHLVPVPDPEVVADALVAEAADTDLVTTADAAVDVEAEVEADMEADVEVEVAGADVEADAADEPVLAGTADLPTDEVTEDETGDDGDDVPAGEPERDPIADAINAVIRLPQRQPGGTGAGSESPAASGPALLGPRPGRDTTTPSRPTPVPRREPVGAPSGSALPQRSSAAPAVQEVVEIAEQPDVEQPDVEHRVEEPAVDQPVAEVVPEPVVEPVVAVEPEVRRPVAPTSLTVVDALDSPAAPEDLAHEESPIFGKLRSNWLSSDGAEERPWTSSAVEAGWDAADRVSGAGAAPLTDAGLPMRRPGNRLVPGGVPGAAPAAPAGPAAGPARSTAPLVRDPETIRTRLAAHAAGVSRGRSAAGSPLPAPAAAAAQPAPQKEADPV
ncbi:ATP-binding protein [Nocardioides taihuensis]|uniref:histidine kinase n=1 Tax=Nocardioides taihuensis TaxID=1835606 RepID=A0ABW0BMX0_9ACTN